MNTDIKVGWRAIAKRANEIRIYLFTETNNHRIDQDMKLGKVSSAILTSSPSRINEMLANGKLRHDAQHLALAFGTLANCCANRGLVYEGKLEVVEKLPERIADSRTGGDDGALMPIWEEPVLLA